jgi:TRAP-type uncharacterized transport system substrate-binding protein
VVIVGCLLLAIVLLRPSAPRKYRIQMTTGTAPRIVLLAEQLRDEAAHHHLDIILTAKEYGSLEALDEVNAPNDIKCALIVGGVTSRDYPHVRTVASVAKEHLHLLVKRELAGKGIAGLGGKRIAMGGPTTSSYHVARDVLAFVDLLPASPGKSGGYDIDPMTPQDLLRELTRIESLAGPARADAIAHLPDAVMYMTQLPSPLARQLVAHFGYKLVDFHFAESYELDCLSPPDTDGVRLDRSVFTPGVIPAYTYSRGAAEPAKDCQTICAPLILVAEDDADPEAVALLLETIYDSTLTPAIRPPAINEQVSAFPRHPGTDRYLHRKDPLLTPETMSGLAKLAGGIGAFVSGLIAFYGFLRLRNLNRFEQYYREIGQIEMIARGIEDDPEAPIDPTSLRSYLHERLVSLKCKVLKDFAEGGLRGEGLMAGIIALINDTRESLAEMVAAQNEAQQAPARDKVEQT